MIASNSSISFFTVSASFCFQDERSSSSTSYKELFSSLSYLNKLTVISSQLWRMQKLANKLTVSSPEHQCHWPWVDSIQQWSGLSQRSINASGSLNVLKGWGYGPSPYTQCLAVSQVTFRESHSLWINYSAMGEKMTPESIKTDYLKNSWAKVKEDWYHKHTYMKIHAVFHSNHYLATNGYYHSLLLRMHDYFSM